VSSGIVESSNQGNESGQQQQRSGGSRSQMVQRLLAASANLPAFINDLLTTQAVSVAGTEAAAFLLERGQGEAEQQEQFALRLIAHIRPDDAAPDVREQAIAAFQEIVRPCVAQAKDGAIEVSQVGGGESQFCLVTLLRSEGNVVGASAVITKCLDTERAKQRLSSMQLVAGYFELYSLRRTSEQSRVIAQSHQHVLQLATSVATGEGFEAAAQALCNELATRTGAARVALGWRKGKNMRVKAMSHTEKFDKKNELITQLERVMEECADQEVPVQFDPQGNSTPNVTRESQMFSRANGGNSVLSLPLRRRDEIEGVVVLEFLPQAKLPENAAAGLTIAVDLLAPQLYDRYQNDRWLITKTGISIKNLGEATIGPKHMLAKVVTVLVILGVLVICNLIPGLDLRLMYHVDAPFQFIAQQKQEISAPFEARIDQVLVDEGDVVKKGQALMILDTDQEKIRLADAQGKAASKYAEELKARGEQRTADELIAHKEREALLAEASLYQYRIDHATIYSDLDGNVLTGDWKHKVHSTVKQGDPLFELGDISKLDVELAVEDRDMQIFDVGHHGKLATQALPGEKYDFKVTRIVPLGEAKEGQNVFKVYAETDKQEKSWYPGLAGEAKIDTEKKTILWVWTHRLVEWLRLKTWL